MDGMTLDIARQDVDADTVAVLLDRFAYTPLGTFGRLYLPEFECFTVERPWAGNRPRESCIPEGNYDMAHSRYYRGGYDCYELAGVDGRSLIKIHRGNTMHDVLGCICPGTTLTCINGVWAVGNSGEAFADFMRLMAGRPGTLHIRHTAPQYP